MGRKFTAVLLGILVMGGIVAATRALEAQAKSDDDEPSRVSVFRSGGSYLGVHIDDVDKDAVEELNLPGEYGVLVHVIYVHTQIAAARPEYADPTRFVII